MLTRGTQQYMIFPVTTPGSWTHVKGRFPQTSRTRSAFRSAASCTLTFAWSPGHRTIIFTIPSPPSTVYALPASPLRLWTQNAGQGVVDPSCQHPSFHHSSAISKSLGASYSHPAEKATRAFGDVIVFKIECKAVRVERAKDGTILIYRDVEKFVEIPKAQRSMRKRLPT